MGKFAEALNEQVASEFAASQQYVAIAVSYDAQTLPLLAGHFYRQAVEERNHAMMIVQYLLDADVQATIPGVAAPQSSFEDERAPVELALRQEKTVTEQIVRLVQLAREENEHVGEQFLGSWRATGRSRQHGHPALRHRPRRPLRKRKEQVIAGVVDRLQVDEELQPCDLPLPR
jgi:ferritin